MALGKLEYKKIRFSELLCGERTQYKTCQVSKDPFGMKNKHELAINLSKNHPLKPDRSG